MMPRPPWLHLPILVRPSTAEVAHVRERGLRFGRKPLLVPEVIKQVKKLRKAGETVPDIMRQMQLSKASVYRALSA